MLPYLCNVNAKSSVEDYCTAALNTMQDECMRQYIKDADKDKIEKAVQDTLAWWDKNKHANKDDVEAKVKSLKDVVDAIMDPIFAITCRLPIDDPWAGGLTMHL